MASDRELWHAINRLEAIMDQHEVMMTGTLMDTFKSAAHSVASGISSAVKAGADLTRSAEENFIHYHGDLMDTASHGNTFTALRAKRDADKTEMAKEILDLNKDYIPIKAKFEKDMKSLKDKYGKILKVDNDAIATIIKELTPPAAK